MGDTVDSKDSVRRRENTSSRSYFTDPEARLKEMKGILAEPVKWYSTHRPRLSPDNSIERNTYNRHQKRRKSDNLQRAVMNSQVAKKTIPLKPIRRHGKPESV